MTKPVSNWQLSIMWKRALRIWPSWIVSPILKINGWIPGGAEHVIKFNTSFARDIYNLYDKFPAHLKFTDEEKEYGDRALEGLGVPVGAKFICLNVRDSAYLNSHIPEDWSEHDYRDSDIKNYVLASETLADLGYFVIRMGAKVHESLNSSNSKVIDYATNGRRNDFMDIYLGARCLFCISTGSGWDSVADLFRRPIVYVNYSPIGYLCTFRQNTISIIKHHFSVKLNRELSLSEIFQKEVGFSLSASDYKLKNITLIENSPEEIRDAAIEMLSRLNDCWPASICDDVLQHQFKKIFTSCAINGYLVKILHGEIRARFGTAFLRTNKNWVK